MNSSGIKAITLKELLTNVRRVVAQNFATTYWVSADISDLREDATRGHCYLELVQKNDSSKLIEAKTRAIIYANVYSYLKPYFIATSGQPLCTGMKILAEVSVSFHEQFGMTCVIQNIDPTYTLGDMARKRMETIAQLKEDGIWEMNKELELPFLIKRVAVISSASAAGYGDFCNQLLNNEHGFAFSTVLFPATVQGDSAAESIISALDQIFARKEEFDVVVIIRGGGATTDLLAFDDYQLASSVAQFPIPILTGIGHERDESITDMVAHTRCKTPTAVAAFIYEQMLQREEHLLNQEEILHQLIKEKLTIEKQRLENSSRRLVQSSSHRILFERQNLQIILTNLGNAFHGVFIQQRHRLELHENTLKHTSPETILKRGYSITLLIDKGGKRKGVVSHPSMVEKGDTIRTLLGDGEITSVVK